MTNPEGNSELCFPRIIEIVGNKITVSRGIIVLLYSFLCRKKKPFEKRAGHSR